MANVADSVENNGTINPPENENMIPAGISATELLEENSGAFPELNQSNSLATTVTTATDTNNSTAVRWPGWPGYCVFRLIVPVTMVGVIIGRKGDVLKKISEETRACIKVLDGPVTTPDRIVLVSCKEEPEAYISPAMAAVLRVFRLIAGLPDNDDDVQNAGLPFCSVRLLVANMQATSLIGKQGSLIKSIVANSGASVRILSAEETPFYAAQDERIVDLKGEALKILKALEGIVGHLRKFLVDHTVVPLFEKQVSHTMHIPFSYVDDIIGVEGANIAYIRQRSGATMTIQESPHLAQITVETKGTSSQVQTAEQLIQEFISKHVEPISISGGYDRIGIGYVPAYPPQLSNHQEPLLSSYMGAEMVQYRPTAYSQPMGPSTYTPSLAGQIYNTEYRPASNVWWLQQL